MKYFDKLGFEARDRVTGFKGVISSLSFDLYGCICAVLTPTADPKESKIREGHWFDFKRLEFISKKPVMEVPAFDLNIRGLATEIGAAEKPLPPNV